MFHDKKGCTVQYTEIHKSLIVLFVLDFSLPENNTQKHEIRKNCTEFKNGDREKCFEF